MGISLQTETTLGCRWLDISSATQGDTQHVPLGVQQLYSDVPKASTLVPGQTSVLLTCIKYLIKWTKILEPLHLRGSPKSKQLA